MSNRKILIIAAGVSAGILVLLAFVLRGRVQGIILGLLFIIVFVGVFGGLMLGLNSLKERFFTRPRYPSHVCTHCFKLYQQPESTECEYCLGTFGLQKPLLDLEEFLTNHSKSDIQESIGKRQAELKKALGRNILFIEHDIKNLQRIAKIKAARQEQT